MHQMGKGQNVEYQNVEKLIENLAIHHFVESVN
jgi:hypothetical protein